jgi:hypothetical protein
VPSAVAKRRWDLALGLVTVCEMLPTCWYRYGIDQAVYHYVGAGWKAGLVPYRDAFDVKPPGIYALYALATTLFGANQAAIRVAEILCALAVGFCAARAVRTPGSPRTDGVAGLSALLLGTWHSSLFGFWDTGQAELWQGACVVFAYACLRAENVSERARVMGSGALAALAVAFKTTALVSAGMLALAAIASATSTATPREKAQRGGWFAVGFLAPNVVIVLYFWARGGLPALLEWLGYLPIYATAPLDPEWVNSVGPEMLLARCGFWFGVFGVLTSIGFTRARRATSSSPLWPVLLLATGMVGIVVQRRYFSYHPAVLGPLLVLAAAGGVSRLVALGRTTATVGVACVCAGACFSAPPWTGFEGNNYRNYVLHAWWPFVTGRTTRSVFDAIFKGPFGYSYPANAELAEFIRLRHPLPADRLHIRGFNPVAYVLSGLYSSSRFMIESPLENAYVVSRRPGWAREHDSRLLRSARPRFFVTLVGRTKDVTRLQKAGYGVVGTRDRFVLLELGASRGALQPERFGPLFRNHGAHGTLFGGIPFRALFDGDNGFQLTVQDRTFPGSVRMEGPDLLCATVVNAGVARERCGRLYYLDGGYIALDDEGRELATLFDDGN